MKTLVYLLITLTLIINGCKKPNRQTGIMLSVTGPRDYYMEVVVGTPVEPITDVYKWRPDVMFWSQSHNGFVELAEGSYTIVLKNYNTSKIISIPVTVRSREVATVTGSL